MSVSLTERCSYSDLLGDHIEVDKSQRAGVNVLVKACLKVFSFTPGFSPVSDGTHQQKTVSTVFSAFAGETVKTVPQNVGAFSPG